MDIIIGVLEQGLIYAIMAFGVYITYTILDFPDLTVDGSLPLGAAVSAVLITKGVNPYLSLLAALGCGAVAGFLTGFIHVKFKVRNLLASIIMMTALYSVNLHIAGKANLALFGFNTIFNSGIGALLPASLSRYHTLIIALVMVVIVKIALDLYLRTKSGYLLRAVGDNPVLVTSLAKNNGSVKILGLTIANALVALSGAILAQQQRFFEATVIIGTNMFKNVRFIKSTTAVIIGSILYKGCVAGAIALGMNAIDLKLIMAILFLVILIVSRERKKKVKQNA
jgi:putative ABC transport system permease protein